MKIIPIKIETTQKNNLLEIRWNPNNVCNFSCRYCHPGANEGNFPSPRNIDLIIDNFNYMLSRYKEIGKNRFHIKIAGGEPTMWKNLDQFVESIKKNNDVYISLITNGSRTVRWWKEHGHLIDNVHLTHHVAQGDLDHTIQVADIMYELGKKITVKVLMDTACWQQCVDAVEYMKKNSKHSWFIMVAGVFEPEEQNIMRIVRGVDFELSQEQRLYIKKSLKRMPSPLWFWKHRDLITSGEMRYYESIATLSNGKKRKASSHTYINENWNYFKGWHCNIGIEGIFINWDGNITGACGEYVYGLDYAYNILKEDFIETYKVDFVPTVCSKPNCICGPETHITKFKPI
jgi:hypothetical protein